MQNETIVIKADEQVSFQRRSCEAARAFWQDHGVQALAIGVLVTDALIVRGRAQIGEHVTSYLANQLSNFVQVREHIYQSLTHVGST